MRSFADEPRSAPSTSKDRIKQIFRECVERPAEHKRERDRDRDRERGRAPARAARLFGNQGQSLELCHVPATLRPNAAENQAPNAAAAAAAAAEADAAVAAAREQAASVERAAAAALERERRGVLGVLIRGADAARCAAAVHRWRLGAAALAAEQCVAACREQGERALRIAAEAEREALAQMALSRQSAA